MTVTIDEVAVADPPHAWTRAGFSVDSGPDADPVCRVGDVRIRLVGRDRGSGIIGWSLRGSPSLSAFGELEGIPTTHSATAPAAPAAHSNGVTAIDHVVLLTPDLSRTVTSLAAIGVDPRRERNAELGGRRVRQVFFRFGGVIIEVVGSPETASDGPTKLWGITYVVADIDATATFFGPHTGPVKDAVQPGRRIATLRHRDLGMSVRTAVISATRHR